MAGLLDFFGTSPDSPAPAASTGLLSGGGGGGGGFLGGLQGALNQIADPEGLQKQRALHTMIALEDLRLRRQAAEEKPSVVWHPDANGNQVPYLVQPMGRGVSQLPIQGQATQATNPYSQGKTTAEESQAALFGDRAASSHGTISKFEDFYNRPGGTAAGLLEKKLPETAFNLLAGNDQQQLMNAKRSFVNALLRRESGAAINAGEFTSYDKEYFPQPGDSAQVIEQKRQHRQEVIEGLFRSAGPRYTPPSGYISRKEEEGTPKSGNYSGVGAWGAPYRVQQPGGLPLTTAAPSAAPAAAPTAVPVPAAPGGPRRVTTQAEWATLSPGTQYIAPDGKLRTKQ